MVAFRCPFGAGPAIAGNYLKIDCAARKYLSQPIARVGGKPTFACAFCEGSRFRSIITKQPDCSAINPNRVAVR
jgi:hypothetical protein